MSSFASSQTEAISHAAGVSTPSTPPPADDPSTPTSPPDDTRQSGGAKAKRERTSPTGAPLDEGCRAETEPLNDTQKNDAKATKKPVPLKLAIFHHPACELHEVANHPEQPERVRGILAKLRDALPASSFRQVQQRATDEHLLMFHSARHVAKFNDLCTLAEATPHKRFTYDEDTTVMSKTRDAAYFAVGAMIEAVDGIFLPDGHADKIDTAFCCVRPPGHHAERGRSMGFCFMGNASIGAKYAQKVHGVGKVAVIDFDVHHGNVRVEKRCCRRDHRKP